MNLQEEKNKLETLEYFRKEIHDRHLAIEHFKKLSNHNSDGFFEKLFRLFGIDLKTSKTRCIDGDSVHIEIDIELKKDIISAFEKSKERLEKLYKENVNEFMSTVEFTETINSSK